MSVSDHQPKRQATIEFFFDLSSPWTRIAFQNVQDVAARYPVTIVWRPFLVGGVFNAVNSTVYLNRREPGSPRNRHNARWLSEWAELAGVELNFPSEHHPLKSVNAMRFACALEDDQAALLRFAERAFDCYFRDQQNIDDVAVLIAICDGLSMNGVALANRARSPAGKLRLRQNTDEALKRGAFGSPTIFVDCDTLYFGNDQLPLIEQRLRKAGAKHAG